jgi:hypothetical protein
MLCHGLDDSEQHCCRPAGKLDAVQRFDAANKPWQYWAKYRPSRILSISMFREKTFV